MARRSKKEVEEAPEPVKETREEILIRLAGKRVEKACKAISLLANLRTYKPQGSDVDAIMTALGEACSIVESSLRGVKRDSYAFNLRQVPASK